jgi:hypothetical protein
MIKQKILLFLAILLLIGFTNALTYYPAGHSITVQINTDGVDQVEEKYYVYFPQEKDKVDFREKSLELGTSLDDWKQFDPLFKPSFDPNALNKKITYTEGEQSFLQLSYDLSEPLMAKGKEATMMTEYTLKVNLFNNFYQAGLWIIPESTSISIELPPGAEVNDTIEPQSTTYLSGSRKVVNWQGYKQTNKLTLNYIVWKKIDPVVDLNGINTFLFKTQEGIILLLITAIILIAIVVKRKKIASKIEAFVEMNSIIKEE